MRIRRHRLIQDDGTPYPFAATPNMGGQLVHDFLVLHYTSGRSARSSVNWLTNRDARASAHLVIGRDGDITQLYVGKVGLEDPVADWLAQGWVQPRPLPPVWQRWLKGQADS